jgi:hypothetical protein
MPTYPKQVLARACEQPRNKSCCEGRSVFVVEEVFSRPGESDKPASEQEYWVLEILDWTESWKRCFVVQQARIFWSESDREFEFNELETETWRLLIDGEVRYEARRLALMKGGLIHSDMEF